MKPSTLARGKLVSIDAARVHHAERTGTWRREVHGWPFGLRALHAEQAWHLRHEGLKPEAARFMSWLLHRRAAQKARVAR